MIYQKFQENEFLSLIKLTVKNAIASSLYMLMRMNADFDNGEITLNYRTFGELNLHHSDRMKFSRALGLLEKFGLIKKVSADKNGTKAIVCCYNAVTMESLDTVGKASKNLNDDVTICYNDGYKQSTMKSVDVVRDSQIVVTSNVTSSVTHDQQMITLNDRLLDPQKEKIVMNSVELNDSDLPEIDNEKLSHPITDFADYKKEQIKNYSFEALEHTYILEALKFKLSDAEAKHLVSKLNQANQKMIEKTGKEIKNKMAYFQKIINSYLQKKSETFANNNLIRSEALKKANQFAPVKYDANNPSARKLTPAEYAEANQEVPF